MKLKNWVIWLCVAVFLATEAFLFRANQQKDAALVKLHESQQQVEQLQSEIGRAHV